MKPDEQTDEEEEVVTMVGACGEHRAQREEDSQSPNVSLTVGVSARDSQKPNIYSRCPAAPDH
ncbi:hypothetical protein EYF80_057310 [Liparis tanakae]|uniref:Uncharacterized protein n=1 Tax=Liparis tanakae TaxID=230148 RepID=A0A4Z2EV52_9TELE|nr:hypothetical protein EYF80_057310 [Liparis tanakae]